MTTDITEDRLRELLTGEGGVKPLAERTSSVTFTAQFATTIVTLALEALAARKVEPVACADCQDRKPHDECPAAQPLASHAPGEPTAAEVKAAHDAIREALGYRHGNMVNIGGIHIDFADLGRRALEASRRVSPPAPDAEVERLREWKHSTPFITECSEPNGKKYISVDVPTFDALHDAHDLIVAAFKAAGVK